MSAARVIASGLAAGLAYLAAQAIDLKVTGNRVDDRLLLGTLLPGPERAAKPVGTALHLGNSVIASAVYHRYAAERLQGPGWRRGVVFAAIEHTALYPFARLERFHPGIRAGKLDSYWSWTAFGQGLWRHVAFGAVLGAIAAPATNAKVHFSSTCRKNAVRTRCSVLG